jgi:phosphonoacetaldehyde hydrolase
MTLEYRGPLKAVVLDWAGTIVDHGSRAPMGVFVRAFAEFGVEITVEEARRPMGLPKWDHIKAVGTQERIAAAWQQVHGRSFADSDVDALYEVFVPMNVEVIPQFADLIPGALETVAELRARGLKIGSTTGYNRQIMDVLVPLAATAGYSPDCLVCAGDVASGRPTPLMMYKCFVDLGVWPAASVIKVDDTVPGIIEGLAAGCWTVGIAATGNGMGLSVEEAASLPADEFARRRDAAAAELTAAGAHMIIDSIAELPSTINYFASRVSSGSIGQ